MKFSWNERRQDDRANPVIDRAQALLEQAAAARDCKDTESALALYAESMALFSSRGLFRQEADGYHAVGLLLVSESRHIEALAALSKAIQHYRKLNLRGHLAVALRDAGYAHLDLSQRDEAQLLLTESHDLFEATTDRCGMASALEGLGLTASESKDFIGAQNLFQRSLVLHRELELNPESAVSLVYLSMTAMAMQDLPAASARYRESIERFREHSAESSLVPPLITLGDVAFSSADEIQIGELLQAALAVFGASRLKRSWDSAMSKLGGVAQRRNVSRTALETYRHSLSSDPARDEWGAEALACLGLGCVAYRQGKPKIGKALVARSLNVCRKNGDLTTIRYVLNCAADHTFQGSHFPDAYYFYAQCAETARDAGDTLEAADASFNAAWLAARLKEFETVRKHCVECVPVYRANGFDAELVRAESLLGTAFVRLGDAETGIRIHQASVKKARELNDPINITTAVSAMGAALMDTDMVLANECLIETLELTETESCTEDVEVLHNIAEMIRLYSRTEELFGTDWEEQDLLQIANSVAVSISETPEEEPTDDMEATEITDFPMELSLIYTPSISPAA